MDQDVREAVLAAAARPEVREAVLRVYTDLQTEIDRRRPVCVLSGCCCRFEEFGHRLYVTTMELGAFVRDFPMRDQMPHRLGGSIGSWTGGGCPLQVGRVCGVHSIRPFGCRIFFCDSTSSEWQHEQYERFHAELKQLHVGLRVPYFYVEWRHALRGVVLGRCASEVDK